MEVLVDNGRKLPWLQQASHTYDCLFLEICFYFPLRCLLQLFFTELSFLLLFFTASTFDSQRLDQFVANGGKLLVFVASKAGVEVVSNAMVSDWLFALVKVWLLRTESDA